jgi:putative sigma-54 modulation protein
MNLQITGRHLEVTDAIREFINEKLVRLERHFDHITGIHVILDVVKDTHIAEAKINLSGSEVFAESKMDDLYAAIDTLLDKLDRQVLKYKEKIKNHHATASKFEQAIQQTEE